MGVSSSQTKPFGCFVFLFSLFLFFSQIAAQVNGRDEASAGIKDLGRRSKIFVDKIKTGIVRDVKDPDFVSLGVALDSGLGLSDAFFASLSMIIVSEIGDETFIIAALMAMRHPKSIVLSGALSALFVMTVLSTGLGRIVPNLISRKHTNSAATVLYAFFGLRLLYIAWRSDSKASQKKEMEEVEEKLEGGQGKTQFRRFFSRFCTPIYLESFILTFLAEWGDRSQIATIAVLMRPGPRTGTSEPDWVGSSGTRGPQYSSCYFPQTILSVVGQILSCYCLQLYFLPLQ